MIEILLPYPEGDPVAAALGTMGGRAEAERAGQGLARLTSSASLFQLVPGDVLHIDDEDRVTGIYKLADLWLFSISTSIPGLLHSTSVADPDAWNIDGLDDVNWEAAALAADRIEEELGRRTPVLRTTAYSIEVVTDSRVWFDQWLEQATGLHFYQVIREPGQSLTWEQARSETMWNERPVIVLNNKELP